MHRSRTFSIKFTSATKSHKVCEILTRDDLSTRKKLSEECKNGSKVRWSQTAQQDFDDAAAYIAKDSPANAAKFVQMVIERASALANFPERHAVVSDFSDFALRETYVYQYRLLYVIHPHEIRIVGLIHGARSFPGLSEIRNRLSD